MSSADRLTAARPVAVRLPRVRARWAVLLLALLSFVLPSAPTYDPWAWIVWGREITQLDLMTTDGPSWKPLPVLLTTPFALLGDLAPDLWLLVARAGAIAGVWLAFVLASRLAGGSVVAGLAAAAGVACSPWTVRHMLLGNSEGLFVALLLGAAVLHLDGRHRAALLAGLGCALLRPEAWPFFGLYGLWRLWRGDRALALASFASLPLLWLGPEWWGSGNPLRAMDRAQQPNPGSAAFDAHPWLRILEQFAAMLPWAAWAGLGALAVLAARAPHRRVLLALAGGVAAWVGLVMYMTSDGFAGNTRYLIPAAAVAVVLAGAGLGLAAQRLRAPVLPAAAVAALALTVPGLWRADTELELTTYQARLTDALPGAIAAAGGADALLACGAAATGPYQVPSVAWALGVHTTEVTLRPSVPGVVLRARNLPGTPVTPSLRGAPPLRTLQTGEGWRILSTCP